MVHILTSNGNIFSIEVSLQEPRINEPATTVYLKLPLKKQMSNEIFLEQQGYLNTASIAAYVSLNKIDQRKRFRASVNLTTKTLNCLNFITGSTSSGLGFTLALFNAFWTKQLKKGQGFTSPILATGEIQNNGDIKGIGYIEEKLQSTILFAKDNNFSNFIICIPKENEAEISPKLFKSINLHGGQIISANRVQELLAHLLGNEYDGDPLGRWEPFKGLNSFEYEDSVRFYGRKKDVESLYTDLENNQGILIVSGPESSGKSSLIKAGLIPFLVTQKPDLSWQSITPREISGSIISIVLAGLLKNSVDDNQLQIIEGMILENQKSAFEYLKTLFTNKGSIFLLHIDQFEEFFNPDFEQGYLNEIAHIQALINKFPQIKVVFSIRDNFVVDLIKIKGMESPILRNLSETLSVTSLQEIVIEQSAFSGISFEKNLAEKIIDDATKIPSPLPIVEFVLTELFWKANKDTIGKTVLKFQDYNDLGCLGGAIANRAEFIFKDMNVDKSTIDYFFAMLIGITNEKKVYAKEFELIYKLDKKIDEYSPSIDADDEIIELIKRFKKANLLRVNRNFTIQLIHESLLTQWSRMSEWIDKKECYLTFYRSIHPEFNQWKESGRDFNELKPSIKVVEGLVYCYYDEIPDRLLQLYIFLSFKKWFFEKIFIFLPLIILIILFLVFPSNSASLDINLPIVFENPPIELIDET